MKIFSMILALLTVISCESNKTESLSIEYKNQNSDFKLVATFTEYHEKKYYRRFDEQYEFFRISCNTPDFKYTDKFYYMKKFGLFRILDVKDPILLNNCIANATDVLWIWNEDYCTKLVNKKSKNSNKGNYFKTYSDREYFGSWDYSKKHNRIIYPEKIKISLYNIRYDSTYADTVRTFLFEIYNPEQWGNFKEYKSYDSDFNLIDYTFITLSGVKIDSIPLRISKEDYNRLKEFRESVNTIFKCE